MDTQAILQEVFHPREVSTGESVMEFARQRQGIVVAVSLLAAFLLLAGLHQFVTMRNARAVTGSPAVPLTEITDVAKQQNEAAPVPMPELDFPYEGRPQALRTFIVEPGAVAPAAATAPLMGAAAARPQPAVQPFRLPTAAEAAAAARRPVTPPSQPRTATPPQPAQPPLRTPQSR